MHSTGSSLMPGRPAPLAQLANSLQCSLTPQILLGVRLGFPYHCLLSKFRAVRFTRMTSTSFIAWLLTIQLVHYPPLDMSSLYPRYQRLPKEEPLGSHRKPPAHKTLLYILVATVILISTILLVYKFNAKTSTFETTSSSISACGDTVAAAQAAGCTFDLLSHLWLPRQCLRNRNAEFMAYSGAIPWQYWSDADGLHPIDLSEQLYGTGYWSTEKEHLAHCAFTLLRTSDYLRDGGRWERKVTSAGHFEHCVRFLLNRTEASPTLNQVMAFGRLAFGGSC